MQISTSAFLNYTTATRTLGASIGKDPTTASAKTDSSEMESNAQVWKFQSGQRFVELKLCRQIKLNLNFCSSAE